MAQTLVKVNSMKNGNGSMLEMNMKKQVVDLYEVMKTEKLEELEIKERDFHIHLKRKGKNIPLAVQQPVMMQSPVVAELAEQADDAAQPAGETVKSPIMGMFYRAPSPSSPPFVKEGDVVDAGKTLCIVEAMKVMNEIKSGFRVKIVKILVDNGKSINASQDLFIIERA